jgi:hypothetical protein
MAEMSQYHIAQMVRRINGKFLVPPSEHADKQVEAIKSGYYDDAMKDVMALGTVDPFDATTKDTPDIKKMKELYNQREMEPHTAEKDWRPQSDFALLK